MYVNNWKSYSVNLKKNNLFYINCLIIRLYKSIDKYEQIAKRFTWHRIGEQFLN